MTQEQVPSPENIDAEIERFLETLDSYISRLWESHPELQEEWYWVEMEARVGLDRQTAKEKLETFIGKLQNLSEKGE